MMFLEQRLRFLRLGERRRAAATGYFFVAVVDRIGAHGLDQLVEVFGIFERLAVDAETLMAVNELSSSVF